jgi:LPS-assembly lipoprotein
LSRFLPRRHALGLAAASLLGGCGWHTMYGRNNGEIGPVQTELAAIDVNLIPDRPGQMLRQALQERFERAGQGAAHRYDLKVGFGISGNGEAIRSDNATTRTMLLGTANWWLNAQDKSRTLLAQGSARVMDAYNIFDSQYFNSDLNNEAAQKRLAEALADRIMLQISAYFDRVARVAAR